MLQVDSACALKDGVFVLKNISFRLQPGEVLFVVGPNGAGKTSLIKALTGELKLASGAITFDQAWVWAHTPSVRCKHMAVLPQNSGLNFPYSVRQVVILGRTPHNSGLKVDTQVVNQALQALDLTHLQHRTYSELSAGEKQRTQLARVMVQIGREQDAKPRLLILDEPTSCLDIGHKQQLMEAIVRFSNSGVAVLIVEHDLNIALRYSDSVLVLHKGEVAAYGAPQRAINEKIIDTVFGARARLLKDTHAGTSVVSL